MNVKCAQKKTPHVPFNSLTCGSLQPPQPQKQRGVVQTAREGSLKK